MRILRFHTCLSRGGFSYVPYTYMKLYAVDVVGL